MIHYFLLHSQRKIGRLALIAGGMPYTDEYGNGKPPADDDKRREAADLLARLTVQQQAREDILKRAEAAGFVRNSYDGRDRGFGDRAVKVNQGFVRREGDPPAWVVYCAERALATLEIPEDLLLRSGLQA